MTFTLRMDYRDGCFISVLLDVTMRVVRYVVN